MRKVVLGMISEFEPLIGRAVKVEDKEIAVFRLSTGDIKAIENCCPDQGARLSEGMVAGSYLYSPYHDWKISLEDGKVQEPDNGSVRTYQVVVEEAEVYLYIA